MKPKHAGLALALALFGCALWLVCRPASPARPATLRNLREGLAYSTPFPRVASGNKASAPPVPSPLPAVAPNAVSTISLPVVVSSPADPAENNANSTAQSGVRDSQVDAVKVRGMVHDFHTLMGENPVGTNAEIMREMMGGNPRQAQLGPPEGMSLNGKGELVDQWNTPYFFHQLSKDLMEIRSAGPDKVFGTKDDIVVR